MGKSSLINALVGKKGIAPISQRPGKTQFLYFYKVEEEFVLVDLPGYGYAEVPQKVRRSWGAMVETYLKSREVLKLVLLLLDIRRPPTEHDLMFREWLDHRGLPFLAVATKADKVPKSKRGPLLKEIALKLGTEPSGIVLFSSLTGEGVVEVWKRIKQVVSEGLYEQGQV